MSSIKVELMEDTQNHERSVLETIVNGWLEEDYLSILCSTSESCVRGSWCIPTSWHWLSCQCGLCWSSVIWTLRVNKNSLYLIIHLWKLVSALILSNAKKILTTSEWIADS